MLKKPTQTEKQKFTIITRVRPALAQDSKIYKTAECQEVVSCTPNTITILRKNNEEKIFRFNHVCDPAQQHELYEHSQHLVQSVFDGFNATFLAYGQTGTGKTYTVFGANADSSSQGFFFQSVDHVFSSIKKRMHQRQFAVKVSFTQFYLDNIYDLLVNNSKKLEIKQSTEEGIYIKDLTEVSVKSPEELFNVVRQAIKVRKTEETSINKRSSRSHAVIQLVVLQRWNEDGQTRYLKGALKIVDLAGSQRVSKTESYGNRLEEAKRINKEITTLGKCINMLAQAEKEDKIINQDISNKFNYNRSHISFRDSKITRFLSESLDGKSRIVLCVCVSRYVVHVDETFSSLMFGAQASTLKVDSKRNDVYTLKKSVDGYAKVAQLTPSKRKEDPRNTTPSKKNFEPQSKERGEFKKDNKLLEKFKSEVREINAYLLHKGISTNQSKENLQQNLVKMQKLFELYRKKAEGGYQF